MFELGNCGLEVASSCLRCVVGDVAGTDGGWMNTLGSRLNCSDSGVT